MFPACKRRQPDGAGTNNKDTKIVKKIIIWLIQYEEWWIVNIDMFSSNSWIAVQCVGIQLARDGCPINFKVTLTDSSSFHLYNYNTSCNM